MKLIKLLPSLVLLTCFNSAFAQQQKMITYLKDNGVHVQNPDSANFVRIITAGNDNAGLFDVQEYYYPNKVLKFAGKSSTIDHVILEGAGIWYYPSGIKREEANYKNNRLNGDNYTYYPNGKLYTHRKYDPGQSQGGSTWGTQSVIIEQRDSTGKVLTQNSKGYYIGYDSEFKDITEQGPIKDGLKDGEWKGQNGKNTSFTELYDHGFLKQGRFTDNDGKVYEYNKRDILPEFFGGVAEFGKFLGAWIKYPSQAYAARKSGVVIIGFVVERDGGLSDIVVKSSPDAELSTEALRVLKQSPRWVPGKQFGKPVRVSYAVPVRFAL